MENEKTLEIVAPEGYEIDKEKSTIEKIIFKKKEEIKLYTDVAKKLFEKRIIYFPGGGGDVVTRSAAAQAWICDANNAPTQEQWEWLLSLNKLQNVANCLNGDWKPDWHNLHERKWHLYYNHANDQLYSSYTLYFQESIAYFETKELTLKAIEILGEEEIKTALGVYKK